MAKNNVVFVSLRCSSATSGTTSGTELDLGPYINAGKREIIGVWAPQPDSTCTTDGAFANKFQESATTVDSDFSDISGAAFTSVTAEATPAFQSIEFTTMKRYIRSYATITGGTAAFIDATGVILEARSDT